MAKTKTGIFSGSFNPIHIGHLALANYLCEFEGLDEVWFMVTPHNPFKNQADLWPDELRLQLVQLAIEGYPRFRVSDFEFHLPRPSYTIHTLNRLKQEYPEREFQLIIGSDNWMVFDRWFESERIVSENKILVYPRPGFSVDKSQLPPNVHVADSPIFEISSTFIREALATGKDIRYFLHPAVYKELYNRPEALILSTPAIPENYSFRRRCSVIITISAGAPIRIFLFEVPIPLVTIIGILAELYFNPVRKRLP